MRSLWIPGVVLIISALIGCQAGINGLAVSNDSNNAGPNGALTLNITQPMDESVVRSNPITVSGNTRPGVDVMINGLSIGEENGHFSVLVELEPGPNTIDISAADSSGKQTSKYLTVVYVP
jgi:hypothetical protein